jgi:hypothetical protein
MANFPAPGKNSLGRPRIWLTVIFSFRQDDRMIRIGIVFLVSLLSVSGAERFDVVVYGGTAGGITAAVVTGT